MACASLGLAALLVACAPATRQPDTHVVEIRGFAFVPERVELAAGDTVIWVNHDIVPHTATDEARAWDSGSITPQQRWSLVPSTEGTYAYLCTFHPTMRGTLVVR